MHRVIKFNQRAWLKIYIDQNTKCRKEAKNEFEKNFFKLMNNSVYGTTVQNVRNHRGIKLVKSDKRRKRLVSELKYHSHKNFSEYLMATEMKKTKIKMNKPIYPGMSILDISKTLMYESGMTILNRNMETEINCYADTDSFLMYIITKDFFEDTADDVKIWFDTSRILESLAGCRTMFLFAVFCKIGRWSVMPIDFMSN